MAMSKEWSGLSPETKSIISQFHGAGDVPVGQIAKALGVTILVSNLGPGRSGQISRGEQGYVIKINRFESKERQRFTVAHELAHYLLHRDIIDASPDGIQDNVLYRSGAPERIEFEANRLAADILMPEVSLKKKMTELGGRVTEAAIDMMAEHFKVSKAAMEIRLGAVKNLVVS